MTNIHLDGNMRKRIRRAARDSVCRRWQVQVPAGLRRWHKCAHPAKPYLVGSERTCSKIEKVSHVKDVAGR